VCAAIPESDWIIVENMQLKSVLVEARSRDVVGDVKVWM